MRVSILRIPECPSWMPAHENLLKAIDELNLDAQLSIQVISDEIQAKETFFAGSPSVTVEGKDLFPTSTLADHKSCRIYVENGKPRGFPSVEAIREKLAQVSQ